MVRVQDKARSTKETDIQVSKRGGCVFDIMGTFNIPGISKDFKRYFLSFIKAGSG